MALNFLAGAEGSYPVVVKLVTGDNAVTLSTYGLAYNATTNPRGINSADDYVLWSEMLGTYLTYKITAGAIVKSGTGFTLVATSDLNNVYVTIWVIPMGGQMRTVI